MSGVENAGWLQVKLADVAEINPGRTKPEDDTTDVTFLSMGDVSETGAVIRRQQRSYLEVAKGFTSFAEGDVLVAKITPCFENGKGAQATNLLNGIGFGSTEFHVIRANPDRVSARFLYWHTRSDAFRFEGEQRMVGSAGQKRVPTEFLKQYQLALPPLPEQQKIAAILTTVDDKLDLIARQISATQTLKQGLMQTLFTRGAGTPDAQGRWHPHTAFQDTELGRIPVPWTMRRLGDVAPLIRRPVEIDTSLSYPELGLRSYGKGTFHKPALLGSMVGNKRLFEIKAGDLLLSNVFAWEGAVAVANPEDDGRFGSHRYITCKVDAALADTRYICRYLVTPAGTDKLSLASPGGAGRNKTLGLGALADIEIPCPSIEEQRKITMVLDSVDDKLTTLTTQQTHYQSLKRGLMQKLLTGQWRVRVDAAALAPVNEEAPA